MPPIVLLEFRSEIPRRSLQPLVPDGAQATTVDPLANPSMAACPLPLEQQVAYWISRLGRDGGPLLVLAYCSGAVLAEALTSAWPGPAAAVLLDPVSVGPLEPGELLGELAGSLDLGADLQNIPEVNGLPAEEAFRRGLTFLRGVVSTAAPDLPKPIAESLLFKHVTWFSYTLAAASQPLQVSGRSRVLVSDGMSLPDAWAGSHVEYCDTTQAELFCSEAARGAVRDAAAALDRAAVAR